MAEGALPREPGRRFFLRRAGAALLLGNLGVQALAQQPSGKLSIGLQLFSLDAEMNQDIDKTLRAVRTMGYHDVELVGYYGLEPKRLRGYLNDAGLRCNSIHIRPNGPFGSMPGLAEDSDRHFRLCRDLGVRYVVCPGPWLPRRIAEALPASHVGIDDIVAAVGAMTEDDWRLSAHLLNRCAERARSYGLQLLYHNGNFEFVKIGSRTGFDCLLQDMDPSLIELELDCGWVMAAGHDPVEYLRQQRYRVRFIHIKDMTVTPPNSRMLLNPAQIGEGIVDWPALLAAAVETGVARAYVEQEAPFARTPLQYARNNLRFLMHLQ